MELSTIEKLDRLPLSCRGELLRQCTKITRTDLNSLYFSYLNRTYGEIMFAGEMIGTGDLMRRIHRYQTKELVNIWMDSHTDIIKYRNAFYSTKEIESLYLLYKSDRDSGKKEQDLLDFVLVQEVQYG